MLFNCFLLAICVSIDALGIGLTYGLKNTKITFNAKLILFVIAICVTYLSTLIGKFMRYILPYNFSNIIGCILLCAMGLWIIIQALNKKNEFDLDHSNQIEGLEAIYLGIALSLDSIGIGIGSSILSLNPFLFSIFVAIFEIFFLLLGSILGKKIKYTSNIPQNIWSIIAGSLLIFVGISKIIF